MGLPSPAGSSGAASSGGSRRVDLLADLGEAAFGVERSALGDMHPALQGRERLEPLIGQPGVLFGFRRSRDRDVSLVRRLEQSAAQVSSFSPRI